MALYSTVYTVEYWYIGNKTTSYLNFQVLREMKNSDHILKMFLTARILTCTSKKALYEMFILYI